ncbi:hypothetical protein GGF50DRAFT_92055 [Schizophyllum commune]
MVHCSYSHDSQEDLEGWAEKSGMSYNNEEGGCGVVPKTEAAWKVHTNLYPEIKPYKSKPWGELYDLMRKVCTKVVVKGKQVYVPHATPAPKFSKKAKLDESDLDTAKSLPDAALDGDNDEADAEGNPDGSDIKEIELKDNHIDYLDDNTVIVGPEQKMSASVTRTVAVKCKRAATTTPHVPLKRSRKTKTDFLDGLGDNVNKVTSALLTIVNHMGPSQPDASLPTPSVLEVPPIPSTPPSSAKRISTFDPSPIRMANTVMAVYKQERWLDPDDAAIFVHYLETNWTAIISCGAMLDSSASEDARQALWQLFCPKTLFGGLIGHFARSDVTIGGTLHGWGCLAALSRCQ